MSSEIQPASNLSVSPLSFGIVAARYNRELTDSLLDRIVSSLTENGEPENLTVERVPGTNEIPSALSLLLEAGKYSCMIGIGVVIKGATSHHHLVAESAGNGIQSLALKHNIPIINGIIVTDNLEDAAERITGRLDRGNEFAQAAIEMGHLYKKWTKT